MNKKKTTKTIIKGNKMINSKAKRNTLKENSKEKSYEIKKDYLRETFGGVYLNRIDNHHSKDWLDVVNSTNKDFYEKNKKKLSMGIERKISLHWFRYFFNRDSYRVDMNTPYVFYNKVSRVDRFNWLEVPFPQADKIQIGTDTSDESGYGYHYVDLPEQSYNWYELFLMMNNLMWRQGRVLDIAITSLNSYISKSTGEKIIVIDWNS